MDVSDKSLKPPTLETNVSLNHGEIKHLKASNTQPIAECLENSIRNGLYLDKRVFYQVSEWPDSEGSIQTRGEVEIIRCLGPSIAADFGNWHEPVLVEYGSGDGRKTEILLDAIEEKRIKCTYIGIDINKHSLHGCLARWKQRYAFIKCTGICGSFEDATPIVEKWPGDKLVFSLASTLNSSPAKYTIFLRRLNKFARKICISQQRPDGQQDLHMSYHAENFERFIWRGLQHGNTLLKRQEFNNNDWNIRCTHSETDIYWYHEFQITPVSSSDQKLSFPAFASIKYTNAGFVLIANKAGLEVTRIDKNDDTGMAIYQLENGNCMPHKLSLLQPSSVRAKCQLVFIRHHQAISNIPLRDGLDLTRISVHDAKEIVKSIQTDAQNCDPIGMGDFWPDGLTRHGRMEAAKPLPTRLKNVYRILSSPCLRAMHSAILMAGSFEKVGSRYENEDQVFLQHDSRLREATNWPQDEAAIIQEVEGQRSASYIEVQGGNDSYKAAGTILRRATVDLSPIMPFHKHDKVTTLTTIKKTLKSPRRVEAIENEVAQFRMDLLQLTLEIADEHNASGRTGDPVAVIVTHGGIFNFIVENWNCKFKRQTNESNWEWYASTTLGNGDVTVFEFSNCGKYLQEIPRSSYFEEAFRWNYRNLTEENMISPYQNTDGTPVDKKQAHIDFIERTGTEVATVPTEPLEIVWRGILASEN